ncbi:C-X-C chemokine receptor type 1-like [Clytia hemisphaerica]|uniref:G-protein coupled receptors family 1 profile domain-containing protein n=1 Tax=Clytia hemisphaerica TaxID=252671 RepID=A0A7M5XLL9_9CNID|eukprot:TCONS_00055795-protein
MNNHSDPQKPITDDNHAHHVHGPREESGKAEIILVTIYAIIFIMGLVSNALIFYYFRFKRRRRGKGTAITERLFSYLAMVDFIASIINPIYHAHDILGGQWYYGTFLCKLFEPIGIILITNSGGIFIVIAFDRERTITFASLRHFTKSTIRSALVFVVVYSTAINAYLFHDFEVSNGRCADKLTMDEKTYWIPRIASFILRDCMLIFIFAFTNIRIVSRKFAHYETWRLGTLWEKRKQDSLKLVRMINVMIIVYFMVMAPYDILMATFLVSHLSDHSIERSGPVVTTSSYLKCLAMSSSCLNFFVYLYMHKDFKKFLRRMT